MRPRQTFQVMEELRNNSVATLRRKGVQLSADDSQTVLDVYQQWLLLMIDLDYLHLQTLERVSRRLWIDMIQADVYELNSAFAECLHLVRMQDNKGFKALCSKVSSHLYHLVADDWKRSLDGDPFAARRLVQVFSYTSRLSLKDIDLTQQLLEDYLQIEAEMPESFDDLLVENLNRIIRRWFSPFVPLAVAPKHGPGGVAGHGRCDLQTKYKDLAGDVMTRYAFGTAYLDQTSIQSSLDRISQTIFVPKSYKTFRTISMEPTTLQYLQQGVWREIDRTVGSNPYLRNRIGFHEQERNQQLAKRGSLNRDYATIDLSAASDSVSYELVKRLFRGTWLLRYFVTTRSARTLLPDGSLINLKKFAPMGSALCFPTETVVFASVCELVTRRHRVSGHYSVFGDDIIVPTQCVEDVISILTELGFRVNREKSFYQTDVWFRESCGAEYCDGVDVSPMRISRSYASREQLVRLTKLIELSNSAYRKGFRHLRGFFLQKLRAQGYVALFSPTEVLADNYTNYHAKKRWNPRLQRVECRVTTLRSKHKTDSLDAQDEIIRYRHWMEATADRSAIGDGFESVICRPTVFTQGSWRMKPYEELDQLFIDECTGPGKSRLVK